MSYTDVLDHDESEYERLSLLAGAFDEGTLRRLAALRPRPDWRCLEIGAGLGTLTSWLAGQCPDGEIIATDLKPHYLARTVPASVRVLRHDVTTDDFPDSSFDLIVARWVFMHLPHREQTLARVVRWLAPGGRLLLEDGADLAGQDTRPPATRHLLRLSWNTMRAVVGTEQGWALDFPAPLARAGLCQLELAADIPVAAPGTPMLRFLLTTMRRLEQPTLDLGEISDRDFKEAIAEMAGPDFRALGFTNIAASGRRPGLTPQVGQRPITVSA